MTHNKWVSMEIDIKLFIWLKGMSKCCLSPSGCLLLTCYPGINASSTGLLINVQVLFSCKRKVNIPQLLIIWLDTDSFELCSSVSWFLYLKKILQELKGAKSSKISSNLEHLFGLKMLPKCWAFSVMQLRLCYEFRLQEQITRQLWRLNQITRKFIWVDKM